MKIILLLIFLVSFPLFAVPLTDNVMFAFEKCKSLSYDLKKGELKEANQEAPFDLHCKKSQILKDGFDCFFYEPTSNKLIRQSPFQGESHLGEAKLKSTEGLKISFLIGKKFASYEDPQKLTLCMGIYLFEKEALSERNLKH